MDNLYVYRVDHDKSMHFTKALMYDRIDIFMFGVMTRSHYSNHDGYVNIYLKPDYQLLEKTIVDQNLEGLDPVDIIQNHIDLFETMIQYHTIIPKDMIITIDNAVITFELFAEYVSDRLFEGLESEISEKDFINYINA